MPPKGKKAAKPAVKDEDAAAKAETATNGDAPAETVADTKKEEDAKDEKADAAATKESAPKPSSKKRKADPTADEPSKSARRSSRGAPKSKPTEVQMLNFLLSPAALDLCRPDDEATDLSTRGSSVRTYAGTPLSPFEELLCAIVLSRPISHRLGLRTIRTILNPPYSFSDPKTILAASPEQRHQAMFDARTQHKDKTATQIGLVAKVVAERFGKDESDTSLEKMREEAGKGWDEERDLLQGAIKGLGKTGLDIFFRRVQWLWPEAYPFVDERTARGVEKLGLPKEPEELVKLIKSSWGKLDKGELPKGDEEKARRRAFVVVCERATSADLEGKAEALVEAAASS